MIRSSCPQCGGAFSYPPFNDKKKTIHCLTGQMSFLRHKVELVQEVKNNDSPKLTESVIQFINIAINPSSIEPCPTSVCLKKLAVQKLIKNVTTSIRCLCYIEDLHDDLERARQHNGHGFCVEDSRECNQSTKQQVCHDKQPQDKHHKQMAYKNLSLGLCYRLSVQRFHHSTHTQYKVK